MIAAIENPMAYRLPTRALPRRYDIEIDARLGRRETFGKVTIQLDVRESTSSVELHAVHQTLKDARLTYGGNTVEGRIEQDEERELAIISFEEAIPVGEATLEVAFDGEVSNGLEGLYLSKDGPEELLCTQCEETAARDIFPCFDEPTFKAQFAWKVTTSADATVLANGTLESVRESDDGQSKTWTFAPTKPMSSYLVALVIGDVASTEEEEVNGTPIRVYAMRGKEFMGQYAHDFTRRLLPWYEDYFGVPYHFDKYDQVGVPGFAAGAMENSGLVLFRQSMLLMNPQTASWNAEKAVAHVVAHEFAHMWFGNLVTMKWWDDLWLNESFAEWISYKAVNALAPEYDIWDDSQGGRVRAMSLDALESTHPIYNKVETPSQAAEMFDVITYEKGCAVMRMLESFLGEEAFRAGIRTYMQEFSEDNAAGSDLWRHLEKAAGRPVTRIMESWINQGGYPIIGVSLEGNTLRLTQRRFFSSPTAPADNAQTWDAPLIIGYEDGAGVHELRHLLSGRDDSVQLDVQGDVRWVYANADEIGFYRQDSDDHLLRGLLDNLDKLSPLEQMGLLSDQWALVRNGTNPITRFLEVEQAMLGARNHNVLGMAVGYLFNIEDLLKEAGDEQAIQSFRRWVASSFKERLAELTFEPKEGESQNDVQARRSVLTAMTMLAQDQAAVEQAKEWAGKEAGNPASVDANLAGVFVSTAAQFGDAAHFDKHLATYQQRQKNASSPQERDRYLYSFPFFRSPELVERVFTLLDERTLPTEAVIPLLRDMLGRRHTQLKAWDYLKGHWEFIATLGSLSIPSVVNATGNLPISQREELEQFYEQHLKGVADQSYARAIETMEQLAEFRARTKGDVVAWFTK
ncbi:MAG: M1 family metallopeptidase [Chloroflexota bacterium]|nr:M1 family metallopeptidase [Chloroflexota bacterium]MDQ5867832.1 M1 family metallopeptidase [Chloroflexota bacterium]